MKRHPQNPVLAPRDVPFNATTVFNAAVIKHEGRYVMIFRNDFGRDGDPKFDGTNLGLAFSDDGVKWNVEPAPVMTREDAREMCRDFVDERFGPEEVRRAYDPRLTVIDGRCYLSLAVDTRHGVHGGLATTEDFRSFKMLSLSAPDNRNMVLFPEKINGRFARLERPFPIYGRGKPEAFDMWYAESPDGVYWGNHRLVLGSEEVPYGNSKIGPASPPIRTSRGWLAAIHAVWKDPDKVLKGWEPNGWRKQYFAGLVLLDLENPSKVIGFSRSPILIPEADYELDGFRGSVIFPTGMILEDNGEVKIYYGAADTVIALASAPVDELLDLCEPV